MRTNGTDLLTMIILSWMTDSCMKSLTMKREVMSHSIPILHLGREIADLYG